jgi:hypothetical protein
MIGRLNRIIRGWGNFHRHVQSHPIFARLEVMPTCGRAVESYEMFGPGYHTATRAEDAGSGGCTVRENGKVVPRSAPPPDEPAFVKNGAYAETVEFITALREIRPPYPSPMEILPSVALCHRIQRQATGG